MKISTKYTVYTVMSVVLLNLTAGIFILWGINPLLDQVDMQMSANFAPAAKLNPIMADDRPLIILGFAAIVGISLVFTAVQLIMFRIQIVKPLRQAVIQAGQLSRGDFALEIETDIEAAEELAELGRSLRFLRDRMQSYVNRLQASRTRENQAINRVETFNHLKGDFLSNVSLELKNPLNSIRGFARLIMRDIEAGKYDEELQRKCGIITDSAEILNSFIDNLLNLSKLDSGQYVQRQQDIHTADFLQDISELNRTLAENRRIALTCHYSPEQPDIIVSDRDVLFNGFALLLTGIIKTSPVGSEVSFGCIRSGARVIFWLKAPPCENMQMSLAAMYRKNFLNASATGMAHLSGALMLNLALAKSSFEIINANVSVLGPDEQGSEFIISFNADDLLPEHSSATHLHTASNLDSAHASSHHSRRREPFQLMAEAIQHPQLQAVLLETDENTRKLLEHILRQDGHRLECSYDEKSCIALIAEHHCNLLLIDQQNYQPTLELIKTLKGQKPEPMPYVIVMATHLEDAERQELVLAGVDECWIKPLDVDVVFERFRMIDSGDARCHDDENT